ncbi:MAG: aldo/keto reductase [Bacteroidales bacterium]|nr:aldo/keto reductase [Bacteroidales bacterium]
MEYTDFGNTGIKVSRLGFGAGHIGNQDTDERSIEHLLNAVLDHGITLIDTARSYGESEQRIGRYLSHRRGEFILSTKVGYTFSDKPDWSYDATMGSLHESLIRLKTDYIDIVHLHSCDKQVLEHGEATAALEKAKVQGKIRVVAYSGENDALAYAIQSGQFGSLQCSVNLFDQNSLISRVPEAVARGMGIIAKRPLGNAVWRYDSRPNGHGHAVYFDRLHQLNLDLHGLTWNELSIRYAAFSPGVSSIITGTMKSEHLADNIRFLEKGRLPDEIIRHIESRFIEKGTGWDGLI